MWKPSSDGVQLSASNHFWHRNGNEESGAKQMVLRTMVFDSVPFVPTRHKRSASKTPHCTFRYGCNVSEDDSMTLGITGWEDASIQIW